MRSISSLRDITMRVLIVSALFACAAAAPSHLTPLSYAILPTFAVAPPVPAGDIQAAQIDAYVKVADQAQVVVDNARALVDKVSENQNEGIIEANDLAQEKSQQAFWNAEEQRWQALSELQVAEAKNAALAAANEGAAAAVVAPEPVAAPEVVEANPVEAAVKSDTVEVKAEENEPQTLKAAEEKPAEQSAEAEKKDDVVADVKSQLDSVLEAQKEALKEYNAAILKSGIIAPGVLPAGVAAVSAYNYQPYVAPITYSAYRTFPVAPIQHPGFYAPTVIKSVW